MGFSNKAHSRDAVPEATITKSAAAMQSNALPLIKVSDGMIIQKSSL